MNGDNCCSGTSLCNFSEVAVIGVYKLFIKDVMEKILMAFL
jgi:hypothetical protein